MAKTGCPTVGQLVAERPARSKVFERHGIDFCCGGKLPLDEACAKRKLNLQTILNELELSDRAPSPGKDWQKASLTELCDHIEAKHHKYIREELPALSELVQKVVSVHGRNHRELAKVGELFVGVRAEIESHMLKEEQILFPICRQLDAEDSPVACHCGSVANPIRVMEMEHDAVGSAMHTIRVLTGNYTLPPDGCNSYRAMLARLTQFEDDLHEHIHKENNILFPRAIAREQRLAVGT